MPSTAGGTCERESSVSIVHLVILAGSTLLAKGWHWQPLAAEQWAPPSLAGDPGCEEQHDGHWDDSVSPQQALDSNSLPPRLTRGQSVFAHAVLTVPSPQRQPAVGRPARTASGSISQTSGFRIDLARKWNMDRKSYKRAKLPHGQLSPDPHTVQQ